MYTVQKVAYIICACPNIRSYILKLFLSQGCNDMVLIEVKLTQIYIRRWKREPKKKKIPVKSGYFFIPHTNLINVNFS